MASKQSFPKTLEAVRTHNSSQWGIGDALIAECGAPGGIGVNNGTGDKLKQAALFLNRHGYEIGVEWLRTIRATAAAFPVGSRLPTTGFTAHAEAGDPKTLKAALAARGTKQPLTVSFVKQFAKELAARNEQPDPDRPGGGTQAERKQGESEAARDLAEVAFLEATKQAEDQAIAASRQLKHLSGSPTAKREQYAKAAAKVSKLWHSVFLAIRDVTPHSEAAE